MLYSLDPQDNPQDERVWQKANPNLGVTVIKKNLRESLVKAKNEASKMPTWLTKNMNIWTDSYATWIDNKYWKDAEVTFDDKYFEDGVYLGFDLASTKDIACLAISGRYEGKIYTDYRFYIPLDNINERNEDDKYMYRQWIQDGHMIATPGKSIDYEYIIKDALSFKDRYGIKEAGADPLGMWNIASKLAENDVEVTSVAQNITTLSPPSKNFEKILLDATFHHFGNPVMAWMMTNVVIYVDVNENIKLRKERVEDKIDGPIATIISHAVMIADENNTDTNESKYNNETIIFG